jgi:hypothetical protein
VNGRTPGRPRTRPYTPSVITPRTRVLSLLVFVLLAGAPSGLAQLPFTSFEARSIAMGGAAVALGGAQASFLDNPALLDGSRLSGIAAAGGVGIESGDFLDRLESLSDTDAASLAANASRAASARADLLTLSNAGNGILGTGRIGVAFASQQWGVAATDFLWAGVVVRPDLVHTSSGNDPSTSFAFNTSSAAFRGLKLRDYAVARSYAIGSHFTVGGTAHLLRGTTYAKEESVFATDVSDPYRLSRRALTGAERSRTRLSIDAGALLTVGPVRLGGVVKSINRPDFPFADDAPAADIGTGVTYGRQARVGASAHIPIVGLTAAVDLDLTKNETLVPGLRSRQISGGLEGRLGPFALRGGISVNLESPDRSRVLSAGFGISARLVKADAAVVYRPGKSALGAVVSVRTGI